MLSRVFTTREQVVMAGLAVALVAGAAALVYARWPVAPAAVPIAEAVAPGSIAAPRTPLKPPTRVAPPVEAEVSVPAPAAETPVLVAPVEPIQPAALLGVSVQGAVQRPGLYWLPQEARIQELLDAAGGTAEDADLADINLSARLIDATTLIVPRHAMRSAEGGVLRARGREAVENPAPYTMSGQGLAVAVPAPTAAPSVPTSGGKVAPASVDSKININTATQAELESLPGIGPAYAGRIVAQRPFGTVEDLTHVPGIGDKRMAAIRDLVTVGE